MNDKPSEGNNENTRQQEIDSTPVEITVENRPTTMLSNVTPETIETLAKIDPKGLLRYSDDHHERNFNLDKLKEENRHKELASSENTSRLGLGLGFAFLASVLLYSGIYQNKDLPEKVFTLVMGAFGGAGSVQLLKRQDRK